MLGQTNQTGDQVLNNTSEKLSKLENQVNDLYRALTKFSDINLGNINADGMNSVIDKAQRIITELGNIRQSSFSNIGQALDVFDEVLRRLNEDFDKLKNNSNNTMFSGVKESIDKIGQSSADLKNYLQDATVSLDNFFRLMRDQNSANFFSSVLNKDLEQLSKNLSTSSGQLVDLYGKLREMQMIAGTFGSEFASKSLSGLSDVYTKISDITRGLEALQKASSQVTNFGFENPDVIFKQFQDIIDKSKQMIASTHTEISNVSNDMSKYTTTQLSLGLSNLTSLT
jgi:tetrahydromethanopterin S-methyltransferase subunit B